jgi:cytoskeletal protein CcmA (bactofilin family)
MFGRKKESDQVENDNSGSDDLPPLKLRPATSSPPAAAAAQGTLPPSGAPIATPQQRVDIPRRPADPMAPPSRQAAATTPSSIAPPMASEGRKLMVGRDIVLAGEITMCDYLVVEGRVECQLTDCKAIEIRETGFFKGTAEIEDGEIRGTFEGSITVRNRLLIRATGRVTGKIRYGMLEVECGGQVSGDLQIAGSNAA